MSLVKTIVRRVLIAGGVASIAVAIVLVASGAAAASRDAGVAFSEAGVVTLAEYPVSVVEPTPDHQATVAIDDGLWALHASMVCSEDPRHGPVGTWGGGSSNESGITAMATLAFLVNGF